MSRILFLSGTELAGNLGLAGKLAKPDGNGAGKGTKLKERITNAIVIIR